MRAATLAAALLLAGCALPTTIQTRPAEGYPALRFKQTVRFSGAVGNTWEFPAGTVLTGDRRRDSDGALMFCGPMTIRDLAIETRPTCVIRRGEKLFINTEYLQQGFERDLPLGAVEEVRL